jgi:hypothetical protein
MKRLKKVLIYIALIMAIALVMTRNCRHYRPRYYHRETGSFAGLKTSMADKKVNQPCAKIPKDDNYVFGIHHIGIKLRGSTWK